MRPHRPTSTLVAAAIAAMAASSAAYAGGFQIYEQNASGLGVSYAGQAAAANDASTAFWNPAGQSLLEGRQLSVSLASIMPSTKFNDNGTSTFGAFGNGGQGGESALVPSLYGVMPVGGGWSVGLAINAPFGLATEWDSRWAGQFHALRSEIKTLNVNPTVSYKLSEQVSLGAGLSYQQIKAELTNAAVLSPPFPSSVIGTGRVKGDDWAWGWNAGALIQVAPQTRVGVTYRSAIKYSIDGDLSFDGFPAAIPNRTISTDVKLPQTLSVAVAHRLDPRLRLLADLSWTGWDSIQELRIVDKSNGSTVSSTTLNFKNTWRLAVGAEYALNPTMLLRGGLAYDKTPVQDAYRTPRLPDADRVWLSVGMRWQATPQSPWWVDVGYAHLFMRDGSSSLPFAGATAAEAARGALQGTYKASVDLLALQVGFRF